MSDASYNSASRELVISHRQDGLPIIAIPPASNDLFTDFIKDTAKKWLIAAVVWLIAAVVALVIIVAVLGGVLGSRVGNANRSPAESTENINDSGPFIDQGEPTSFPAPLNPPPSNSVTGPGTRTTQAGSTPTFESRIVCHGRVCPSLLSVVQFSDPPLAFIFGREKDSAIWYRQTNGDQWLSDWESLRGDMKSQPMAVSLENGQLHVFAYARNYTIRHRQYADGKWNDDGWLEVGKAASSAPYVKACGPEEMNVVVAGTGGEVERGVYHTFSGRWASWENRGGWASDAVLGCFPPGLYRLACLGIEKATQPLFTNLFSGTWGSWVKVGVTACTLC